MVLTGFQTSEYKIHSISGKFSTINVNETHFRAFANLSYIGKLINNAFKERLNFKTF